MLVLNRMSKRLKSVTKKLFGGKSSSRALSTDTLFQGRSTASRRRAEMMRHIDPSLVGSSTRSQRDEVTFSFSYHFSNIKLLTSLHLIFQEENSLWWEEEEEELELQEEEEEEQHEEEEGHYEGEAWHYEDEVVGVTDLPQDPHPHTDTGLDTSFALL
jgi:hypothetical protein